MTKDQKKETARALFEDWISRSPYEREIARWPMNEKLYSWPGQYKEIAVQLAWEAWCEGGKNEYNS